ncbi:MAG: cation diffusion facilitator family transporter [Pirellulaceae bacterium]
MYLKNASSRPIYRQAIRAALLGLAVNMTLGVVKLIGGLVGNSFALLSDAVNSLGDSLTSVVVVCALWFSQKPGDAEHPYGHSRAESVAATSVALLVIVSALYVGWEALMRINQRHAMPPVWTLWIAGANVLIKEALYRYKIQVGRSTGSMAIIANAWDHRSDAFCSLAVMIGLAIVRGSGARYVWADEAAALVVVGVILVASVGLYRRSASALMDLQADGELVDAIRSAASQVEGVVAVEKLWVRKTGLEYLADIHVEVDARLTVAEGHRIGHEVKDRLVAAFPCLRDVLVHLEPFPNGHRQTAPLAMTLSSPKQTPGDL